MNCYQDVTDECGNVVCRIEKKTYGIVKVHNLQSGLIVYIRNGKVYKVGNKDYYHVPSAPPAENHTI
jgi:hypothetical protein